MTHILALLAALLFATAAHAHGPGKGPNGGAQVDAGDHHVELVPDATSLSLYLYDGNDKPVDARGHKATGFFVVNGRAVRIELAPKAANTLVGTAPVALPKSLKGAVTITLPDGKTIQAKF